MKLSAKISTLILKFFGWKSTEFPDVGNCVVAVAPHTSMWDFVWGKFYIMSKEKESITLIKKEVFKFPLGIILKMFGGIPVDRSSPQGLAMQLPKLFAKNKNLVIAITPEGTRNKTLRWKKGFIHIAKSANVPIVVGFIDYKNKTLGVIDVIENNGDPDVIMKEFKRKFVGIIGKHPEKFITGYENE